MRALSRVLIALAVAMVLPPAVPAAADQVICFGRAATIVGTPGDDVLPGTPGRDVIAGLAGDDVITGLGGNDLICGGKGDDVIYAGPGDDRVRGGTGDDVIRGGRGDDLLRGEEGRDRIRGERGDDTLLGEEGNDRLFGDSGNDVLRGFGGRDVLRGSGGDDALEGSRRRDRMHGGADDDFLVGGRGPDRILGSSGSDVLVGGQGSDDGDGGDGADFCSEMPGPEACETLSPDLFDWLRSSQADALAGTLRDLVVLQTGCPSRLDLDRMTVVASAFAPEGRASLQAAATALRASAAACNTDEPTWAGELRQALVHLEDVNALVEGGAPYPVGDPGTAAGMAPIAVDVFEATRGHLIGGDPPEARSEFWWGLFQGGHARRLAGHAAAGGFDVLFAGSSTVGNAAVPGEFTLLDGRSSYNSSLAGSGPEVQLKWLLEQGLPLADPDTVILGVEARAFEPLDLAPGTCADPATDWDDASALREAAFGPVASLAGVPVEARFFGDPPTAEPSRPVEAFRIFDRRFGPLGERIDKPPNLSIEQKEALREPILEWTVGFEPCQERIDALIDMVGLLEDGGIEVVVVAMPVSDVRAAAFDPSGELGTAAGRVVLADLFADLAPTVAAEGADFFDLSADPLLPEERFRDLTHLDDEGALIFTGLLVDELSGPD